MATFRPFRMLRPDPARARAVCALPYDVMSTDEARAMAEGNPHSFLRVTRAELEMEPGVDPYSDDVYTRGGENLRRLVAEGVLVREETPAYMVYRLRMGDHVQTGFIGAASCEEYDANIVRKHELTRPDKEDDRTRHINLLGAQTGAVFLAYKAQADLDAFLQEKTATAPFLDFVAEDGIGHTAWMVRDGDEIARIEKAFAGLDALYVADGHHRSAAASRVMAERKAANPGHTGDESYNFFLTVAFPHDQVQVLGYHRVVTDLNGLEPAAFLEALAKLGEVTPLEERREPTGKGETTVYLDGHWHAVRWSGELYPADDPVGQLDVAVLQRNVLEGLLGIGNVRTDKRISFVGGIRGTGELQKLVDSGSFAVAFAMFPTSVGELMAIADAGQLMPPKSTWFEPKVRDAMAVALIED